MMTGVSGASNGWNRKDKSADETAFRDLLKMVGYP
jgi:hypothetical protein